MKTILNYINESLDGWEWNDEANKDGKIEVTTTIDDDYNEVYWELEMLSDEGDYWEVRATVVKTDRPRKFKKGWYIDFQLGKDTSVNDIDYYLLQAVEEERGGAWSSGH